MKIKLLITISCNCYNKLHISNLCSKSLCLFIMFLLCFIQNIKAQKDSLKNKSYDYLLEKISIFYWSDTTQTNLYTHAYLEKAKIDNDSLKIIESYYYLSEKNEFPASLKYIDSALVYNKKQKEHNRFHLLIYFRMGYINYSQGKYKEALDNYLNARDYIKPNTQKSFSLAIEYSIGLMSLRIGDYNKATQILKKNYKSFIENNLHSKYSNDYLNSINALSNSYWYQKKLDSAIYYNELYIKETKKYNNIHYHNRSRVSQAIINYTKGNYQQGLDSITKYIPLIENKESSLNLAITYFYKGKILQKLNDDEKAVNEFKKVDTIIQKNKRYSIEIEENYKILYEYYKKKGDSKNHILYLERLLNFDSIRYNNSSYIKSTLLDKYDRPKLIQEKEILINQLESKDSRKSTIVYIMSGGILFLLLMLFYYYTKKQTYKKRFEEIIENKTNTPVITSKPVTTEKDLKIPDTVIKETLQKLEIFENNQQFLSNKITLNSLAKKLRTNSAYLSKIINCYKNQNFSTYLSDLRINYTINALKKQPKLRTYTVKAIAFEVGFKNSKSFTAAFYKHTKLYPSYFIKQLQKREK